MGYLPSLQIDLKETLSQENILLNDKILYLISKDIVVNKLLDLLKQYQTTDSTIEWTSVSEVAKIKGLTSDAVRKQLQNGNFEEGLHFKYIGSRIQVHQGAIERIQRQRRSSNG